MDVHFALVEATKKFRARSEDANRIVVNEETPFFATIVDGHGFGVSNTDVSKFSNFAAMHLQDQFSRDLTMSDAESWFRETQAKIHERYGAQDIGAAAACLMIDQCAQIHVAGAGDCRLYQFNRCVTDAAVCLTQDHRPELPEERERLELLNKPDWFKVVRHGERVFGLDFSQLRLHYFDRNSGWSKKSLRYTRGLGHPRYRPALIETPTQYRIPLRPEDDNVFAFCSDGGAKIVRHVFRGMANDAEPPNLERFAQRAHQKIAEYARGYKHDATIIFFRVFP